MNKRKKENNNTLSDFKIKKTKKSFVADYVARDRFFKKQF